MGAAQVADLMFSAAGGTAIHASHPIERLFRDAHAAAQHATASMPTYEQWGRVLIHEDPEQHPAPARAAAALTVSPWLPLSRTRGRGPWGSRVAEGPPW